MTFPREPQHDEAVQQHGQRSGSLDGSAAPSLRLLEAEVLLAVMEGDFDAPAHRVPSDHFFGRGVRTGRVKGLSGPPTCERINGYNAERFRGAA